MQNEKYCENTVDETKTKQFQNETKYIKYKQWLQNNGVLIDPRIRYPTYFNKVYGGYVGISARRAIQKNRIVAAIPYNIIITVQKVLSVQQLNEIIHKNPGTFDFQDDSAFKVLVLYVVYELIKGNKSFYYQYFNMCDIHQFNQWKSIEINALESPLLAEYIIQQKQTIEQSFMHFLRIFRRYENIFPTHYKNLDYKILYQKAYSIVSTRAFGWSLPSISLIPFADSLNHGNHYVEHYLVHADEELNPSKTYTTHHKKANMSIFNNKSLALTEDELSRLRKATITKRQKHINKYKQILREFKIGQNITDEKERNQLKHFYILHQLYKSGMKNLRQLRFYQTSCSSDNDTDEQEIEGFIMKVEKFKFYDRYERDKGNFAKNKINELNKYWNIYYEEAEQSEQANQIKQKSLQEIKQDNKQLLEQKSIQNSKNHQQKNNSNQKSKQQQKINQQLKKKQQEKNTQYFKQKWGQKIKREQKIGQLQKMKQQQSKESKSREITRAKQKLQQYKRKSIQSQRSSEMSSSSQQSDQAFEWMRKYRKQEDGEYENIYFVMQTRELIKKDDQIHNFYGRRSNRFLLLGYNFVMVNNQYDSYSFRLSIPFNLASRVKGRKTQQIRIKQQRISTQLINHCRCLLVGWQGQIKYDYRITIPFHIPFQVRVLELANEILNYIKNQYISIEQDDEEMIKKSIKYEMKMALLMKLMQRKLIDNQIEMIEACKDILMRWNKGKINLQLNDMPWAKKLYQYLISLERSQL